MDLSWECYLNYSFRCQNIFSLIWSNLSFSCWKKKKKNVKKKSKKQKSTPFVIFRWASFAVHIGDHLRFGIICGLGIISILGVICGRGSFAALYNTSKHAYVLKSHFNFQILPEIVKSLFYSWNSSSKVILGLCRFDFRGSVELGPQYKILLQIWHIRSHWNCKQCYALEL